MKILIVRRVLLLLAVFAILGAAVFCWRWYHFEKLVPGTIAPRGGEAMELVLPNATTHFQQNDPQWGRKKIGGSGETIGAVGCTLSSVAMAISDLGHPIDPPTLNAGLIENGGYTEQGWMIWGSIPAASDDFAEVVVHGKPDHASMDASLKRGEIPIVKFFLRGGIPHWVAVIGKKGKNYLIKDPALANSKPIKLSKRARSIHSLRVVRKK